MKRYHFKRKYREMKNQGFTMVELIVTMALMVILLSIVGIGLSNWIRWTNFTKQNENAEAIFVCAQNQLTSYSENGQLGELQEALGGNENYIHTLDVSELTAPDGNPYDMEKVFQWSGEKTNSQNYQDSICYVMWTAQDYEAYLNGTLSTQKKDIKAILDMLTPYIYDPDVLHTTVCIEFTPDEGLVFAVQCSEYAEKGFQYSDDPDTGKVDIRDRTRDARWETMVGYYGADTLSKSTSRDLKKPVIADLTLNNEETLNLSFRLSKISQAIQSLTYTIKVYDKSANSNSDDWYLTIELDGSKVGNTTLSIGDQITNNAAQFKNNVVPCTVTFGAGSAPEDEGKTIDMNFRAWIERKADSSKTDMSDCYLHLVLDGADLAATDDSYNKMVNALLDGTTVLPGEINPADALNNTFSFHRFGLEELEGTGNNNEEKANAILDKMANMQIKCTVEGSGDLYKPTTRKTSNTEHAYFDKVDTDDNTYDTDNTATISNARHLYNIRYAEDLMVGSGDDAEAGTTTYTYKLDQDIDWNQFVGENSEEKWLYYKGVATTATSNNTLINEMLEGRANVSAEPFNTIKQGFPSIDSLRAGCTLTGQKVVGREEYYTITGLKISDTANIFAGLYKSASDTEPSPNPAGLFLKNSGTIEKLNLDKITVSSADSKVGTFCAENAGALSHLTVLNTLDGNESSSTVTGKYNVGGIVGYDAHEGTTKPVALDTLINNADVSGDAYVGGIIGKAEVKKVGTVYNTVTIESCKNYGAISGISKDSMCIGGIVGYAKDSFMQNQPTNTTEDNHLIISNCISSPQYHGIAEEDYTGYLKYLNGIYVGGIVGYNDESLLAGCGTENESQLEAYIFGYQYVGGIVGFNVGDATGALEGQGGVNAANVIGHEYVGGIVGCNAIADKTELPEDFDMSNIDTTGTDEKHIAPDTAATDKITVENWTNRGVVVCLRVEEEYGSYAGGIAGYNTGIVQNCMSAVRGSTSLSSITRVTTGDYAGGIVGYNNGTVRKTPKSQDEHYEEKKRLDAVCYVTGRNYVGGIVGYNDVDAEVSDYRLTGGTIVGEICVGGYAGFNASASMFISELRCQPNVVEGDYCIGGIIGSNIVSVTNNEGNIAKGKDEKGAYTVELFKNGNLQSHFETNNFLGKILGSAVAGGYIGYNQLVKYDNNENVKGNEVRAQIENQINDLIGKLSTETTYIEKYTAEDELPAGKQIGDAKTEEPAEKQTRLNEVYKAVYTEDEDNEASTTTEDGTTYRLIIAADLETTGLNTTDSTLNGVTADIFVGGVMGYNESNTALTVRNVINQTPITAGASIAATVATTEQANDVYTNPAKGTFQYSYAGGIIGKVGKHTIIDNCSNKNAGGVSAEYATYIGGIAELNEGTIQNCIATAVGKSSRDYVGGIVGLNKQYATVDGCTFAGGTTVTGKTLVGGIASENYGTVQNTTLGSKENNAKVTAYGNDIGGLVGKNYAVGTIQLTANSNSYVNVEAQSCTNVGGIVGENLGTVSVPDDSSAQLNGSISGFDAVGGLIGSHKNANNVTNFVNNATINATVDAGGIVGEVMLESASIQNCVNIGEVVSQNGSAGGIVAVNEGGTIQNCANKDNITALSGTAGGIAATNSGKIEVCAVNPQEQSWWTKLLDTIFKILGIDNTAGNIQVEALNHVGGITGENTGSITDSAVQDTTVINTNKSIDSSTVGGITGTNNKAITDTTVTGCTIQTYPSASNLGGVAGVNNGTISMTPTSHTLTLHVKTEKNYMGDTDAAHNITTELKNAAGSTNMYVDCVNGTVIGPAPNSSYTNGNIGGIAGTNNGTISNAAVSADITGKSGGETFGYGGIAGVNNSTGDNTGILSCSYQSKSETGGGITSNGTNVNLGGIAGLNGSVSNTQARIEECVVGISNKTEISNHVSDKTASGNVGGIVGLHYGKILNCDNYKYSSGTVDIENDAGNIAGIAGTVLSDNAVSTGESAEKMLSTGQNWTVTSYKTANDNGIGGILGFSTSGQDIVYTDNYATVFVNYNGRAAFAGFIGRSQIIVVGMQIANCNNYGEIYSVTGTSGEQYAGGFVGRMKYQAISFTDSKNYGNVSAGPQNASNTGSRWSSGFIGHFIQVTGNMYVTSCYNFGQISGSAVSGFTGALNSTSGSFRQYFYDCVNVGDFISSGTVTGITQTNGTTTTLIVRCRNYGYYSGGTHNSISNVGTRTDCISISSNTKGDAITSGNGTTAQRCYNVTTDRIAGTTNNYTITLYKDVPDIKTTGTPLAMVKDASNFVFKSSTTTKGNRQLAFEEIDPKLVAYYNSLSSMTDAPKAPSNLAIESQEAGQINLTWTGSATSSFVGYELRYWLDEDKTTVYTKDVPYGIGRISVDTEEAWSGKKIFFEVYAYNVDTTGKRLYSSPTNTVDTTVLTTLPTPQVHIEYLGNSKYCYVLDNASDYTMGATIKVSGGGSDFSVAAGASTAYSATFTPKVNDTNTTYNFTASKNGYANSQKVIVQAYTLNGSAVASCSDAIPNYVVKDFTGDLTDNMAITATITASGNNGDVYLNSELYIPDYKLSDGTENGTTYVLPVAVSHDTTHATNQAQTTAQLSSFPSDVLDYSSITMRAYLWQTQNYMTWFGYTVSVQDTETGTQKTTFTKSELLAYLDAARTQTGTQLFDSKYKSVSGTTVTSHPEHPVFAQDGTTAKLNPNYVIQMNTDGTYSILYVPDNLTSTGEIATKEQKKTYTINHESLKVTADNYSKDIRPIPEINETVAVNDNEYTFTWDEGKTGTDYTNARYKLQLYGVDGMEETLLETVETVSEKEYTFVDASNAWNYTRMRLEVTRYGETDDGDTSSLTKVFPATETQTFKIKRRLSQISRPTAPSLTGDNKDALVYDLTWERVVENERGYVSAYEVTATSTLTLTDETRSKADLQKLYKEMSGETEDENRYEWTAGNVTYTATFDTTEDGKTSRTLTVVWNFAVGDITPDEKTITQSIDLSIFEREEDLSISVRALAKEGSDYRDGPDGVPRNFTMPSRMAVPQLVGSGNVVGNPNYDKDTAQVITANRTLSGGVKLTFTPDAGSMVSDTAQEFYQMAVAVYAEAPTDEQKNDTETVVSDKWNEGAIPDTDTVKSTLYDKKANVNLTWDSANAASLTIPENKLSADYAGYWMKIAVRAVSDSNISSYWSDEDPASDATVNYYWVRIPRGKIPTSTVRRNSTDTTITNAYIDDTGATIENVTQPTLNIATVSYAENYHMMLVQNDETYSDIFQIYAEAVDAEKTEWNIFVQSTAPNFVRENTTQICKQDSSAYYVGAVGNGKTYDDAENSSLLKLPLTCRVEENGGIFDTNVWLKYSNDTSGSQFTLVLPDIEIIEGSTMQKLFIDQVLVQACSNGVARYADSDIFSWYRTTNSSQTVIENTAVLSDWPAAPTVNIGGAKFTITATPHTSSEDSTNCYTLTSDSSDMLVYRIEIIQKDENGQDVVVDIRYLSAEVNEDGTKTVLQLPSNLYSQYCGKDHGDYTLRYSVAVIYNVTGYAQNPSCGGISNWAEAQTETTTMPLWLPIPDVTALDIKLSATESTDIVNCCQLVSKALPKDMELLYKLQVLDSDGKVVSESETETLVADIVNDTDKTTVLKLSKDSYEQYCDGTYKLQYCVAYRLAGTTDNDSLSGWSEWQDAGIMQTIEP